MTKAIAWTIAGSDSGGGAGIQADLHTFQSLGVYGCSVITAITAQNSQRIDDVCYLSADAVINQIETLRDDLPAKAIKLGMLSHRQMLSQLSEFLRQYNGAVVCDPVMRSTSGRKLFTDKQSLLDFIFPYVDVLTPNISEAETLLGCNIESYKDVETAARALLALGPKSVVIKGGHFDDEQFSQDYWTNGKEHCWLTHPRDANTNTHGSGCCFSAAITAALSLGFSIKDALVIAKMKVNQGIRLAVQLGGGPGPLAHLQWPVEQVDLPYLSDSPLKEKAQAFLACNETPMGLYPVVDSHQWLKSLLPTGISTIQLRIKDKPQKYIEKEIKASVALAKKYNARLFINDYWKLAIKYKAYGVHLGQEDLQAADIDAIRQAGLRLGLSTHCYYEVARAHRFSPSYIACGPIYKTTSKEMPFSPQGLENLKRWRKTLDYPLVAIGGIDEIRITPVAKTGVDGIAMISAITKSPQPEQAAKVLASLAFSNV